jgi:succinoglycan biosynthesis transport protein ExoP
MKVMNTKNDDDVLLQSKHMTPGQVEYAYDPRQRPAIDVWDMLRILRRHWMFPLIGCSIGLTVGIGYIVLAPAPYKSSARILIDRSINRYLQTNKILDEPTLNEQEVGSQLYVLTSDSVVVPVVRSLKLANDSEFASPGTGSEQNVGSDTAAEPGSKQERAAVEAVLKHLTVIREDVANVIDVTFESVDANKAAAIANAIADTYVATTLQAKFKSTKVIGQWLQERLVELKRQIADTDRAIKEYKSSHNFLDDGIGTPGPELLSNLKIQLANARIAVTEAKQRLDRIHQQSGEELTAAMGAEALVNPTRSGMINFALTNTDLVRLRGQYRDLQVRADEVESRVGPRHSAYIKLRDRLESLRGEIQAEERRISDGYVNEYQIAKAKEAELAASVSRLSGETETSGQLRELETAGEALRNLYNGFLQKYKEIDATQTETLPVQNALIITRAAPPLQRNLKKALVIFAGSLMLGLFLGVGTPIAREWAADVLWLPKTVEQATETPCVVLPTIESKSRLIEEHVLAAPYSRFAEALRNVKSLIDFAHSPESSTVRVVGIVSSLPEEGKTVVAANLAALMTATSGARTLLIDSDLHRRKLTHALAASAREGLIEALDDPSRLAALVVKRQSGLDVLPCVSDSRIPNAAELLGSSKMEHLLAAARKTYDYIIVEIAPIMSVVDVKRIERFIDRFLFVVECGKTKRTIVLDALSSAQVIRDRIVAVVLNNVDPVTLRSLDSSKGARSEVYYQE